MEASIKIRPKNANSRWVALDLKNKIIAEGTTPERVRKEANKITDVFFMMFVPKKGEKYIL